jgi:hypothetical protein
MEQPKMKKLLSLQEYAAREGIQYETAWKRWKGGRVRGKKLSGGRVAIFSRQPVPVRRGQPPKWSEEKVLREVSRLCRDRYLKPSDFPPYLYKLCRKFCGSVRAAKWKADILRGRRWTHGKFLRADLDAFGRGLDRQVRDALPFFNDSQSGQRADAVFVFHAHEKTRLFFGDKHADFRGLRIRSG